MLRKGQRHRNTIERAGPKSITKPTTVYNGGVGPLDPRHTIVVSPLYHPTSGVMPPTELTIKNMGAHGTLLKDSHYPRRRSSETDQDIPINGCPIGPNGPPDPGGNLDPTNRRESADFKAFQNHSNRLNESGFSSSGHSRSPISDSAISSAAKDAGGDQGPQFQGSNDHGAQSNTEQSRALTSALGESSDSTIDEHPVNGFSLSAANANAVPELFTIVVGGERFSLVASSLCRLPGSRLYKIMTTGHLGLCHGVIPLSDNHYPYVNDPSLLGPNQPNLEAPANLFQLDFNGNHHRANEDKRAYGPGLNFIDDPTDRLSPAHAEAKAFDGKQPASQPDCNRAAKQSLQFMSPGSNLAPAIPPSVEGSSIAYFFDRSSMIFSALANVYRTGTIHIPYGVCGEELLAELAYWLIEPSWISHCCAPKLSGFTFTPAQPADIFPELRLARENSRVDFQTRDPKRDSSVSQDGVEFEGGLRRNTIARINQIFGRTTGHGCAAWRTAVWTALEIPNSSYVAMLYMILSCLLVLTTMVVLIMSSMKEFQIEDPIYNTTGNVHVGLEITDTFCVAWFSADYLLRLWACPSRLEYLKSPLSIIDLLAILPFYMELIFNNLGMNVPGNTSLSDVRRSLIILRILRVMRVLRALRVLKVARYSTGFQSMGKALKKSWREMALLIMFTLTANLMFSTAMYYFECDVEGSHFPNIPVACWWCVITMTTVGYGDVYPITVAGKMLGGMVSITGIILLAFPISIIVENFNDEYDSVRTDRAGPSGPPGGASDVAIKSGNTLLVPVDPAYYSPGVALTPPQIANHTKGEDIQMGALDPASGPLLSTIPEQKQADS